MLIISAGNLVVDILLLSLSGAMIPIETTNLQLGEVGRERHSVGM